MVANSISKLLTTLSLSLFMIKLYKKTLSAVDTTLLIDYYPIQFCIYSEILLNNGAFLHQYPKLSQFNQVI